jgi:hypothetical protein
MLIIGEEDIIGSGPVLIKKPTSVNTGVGFFFGA